MLFINLAIILFTNLAIACGPYSIGINNDI